MKTFRRIVLPISLVIVIVAFAYFRSLIEAIPFQRSVYDIFVALIVELWNFINQPIILVLISLLIFLRYGSRYISAIAPWIKSLSAGPVKAEFDFSNLIETKRLKEREAPTGTNLTDEVLDSIASGLDPDAARFLLSIANKKLAYRDIVDQSIAVLETNHDYDIDQKRLVGGGYVVGLISALNGTLLTMTDFPEEDTLLIKIPDDVIESLVPRLSSS